MKTLYVSDLDGTLLNSQSQVSDFTAARLNHLIVQQDLCFTVATARTPATVTRLMQNVHAQVPFIVMAGAALWDNETASYHQVQAIPPYIIASLLEIYRHCAIRPFIYRQHGPVIHAHHAPQFTTDEQAFIDQRLASPLKKLFTDEELSPEGEDPAMLIFSMGRYEALRTIADAVDRRGIACTYMCYHDIFDPDQGYLEIYALGTTKAAAIHRLARQLEADRVVVFGDNLNDIPMMRAAHHSVAVGNAFDEVKAEADEIIGTNDEDAVVRWIEHDYYQNYRS